MGRRAAAGAAHPRRVAKVASQIQREISEMFIYDDVMQRAICPDRGQGNAVSAIAGVTHVYVSNDLQARAPPAAVVKCYVSVYSDDRGRATAMTNLKRLEPYVRSQIGQRVRLRLTPEVRFEYDDSAEEEELVQQVLGRDEFDRLAALAAADAGGGGGGGDDDSGFFDFGDSAEAAGAAGAAAQAGGGAEGGAADDEDEEYEDEEEYEEDFGEEEEYRGRRYDQPGPFDDLFGDDEPAAAAAAQGRGRGGGRGGGRGRGGGVRGRGGGGRGPQRQQQQQQQRGGGGEGRR
ncbi:MAG: ribosome-binding factor A-domain-containing protein [Monoraphidium minutum]|nr:MAG: ribosome-binding factor A-domain-containing protein [Monoraphidium minutum]